MPINNSSTANSWPPDYIAVKRNRIRYIQRLQSDPALWAKIRLYYKTHPIEWIEEWAMTYDPRNQAPAIKIMPFILFPRQKDFIVYLHDLWLNGESGLCEKARDMGASWLCVAFTTWLWLFHDGSAIGWGSRKEEYVDTKGDPKAIFPKIRQTLSFLPRFMLPAGFVMEKDATYMKIINRENGATITGEAGDNIGRGGRTSIYFKDESAHYERPDLIEAALGDNTNVQIDISSVNGSANVFFRRRMAGEIWEPGGTYERGMIRVFIFDWRDHPNKNEQWYNARRAKAEREGLLHMFAQEVDRDYCGSIDKIIIQQEWVRAAIDAHIKLGIKDDGERVGAQDVADGGADKNALVIKYGVVMRFCDHWAGEAGEAAKVAIPHCIEHSVKNLQYDSIGVGAGFKTEINTMAKAGTLPKGMQVVPWNAGAAVLYPEKHIIPGDKESPTNENQYLNLKAQAWFLLRTRFYKTFRAVRYGDKYDHSELISLDGTMPKLHELCMQLSQATHDSNGKGKTIVDKKPDGSVSPNMADAVVMCYCPITKPVGFFSNTWQAPLSHH